jgi:hypothetical protein
MAATRSRARLSETPGSGGVAPDTSIMASTAAIMW